MQTRFNNPLDNMFNVEPFEHEDTDEYSVTTTQDQPPTAVATALEKDAEDIDTDKKIDAVYEAALQTFQNQTDMIEIMEPRYAARNAEVAASYLSIALQAATSKAKLKTDRKRVATFIPGGNKVTNNNLVCTREEIMRLITVDGTQTKI